VNPAKLDFLCVGFTKCGTTSLHNYIKDHPEINLPFEKESPFFVKDNVTIEEWKHFFSENYHSRSNVINGKITPRYTAVKSAPIEIHRLFPETKIIFLLRDPIDRFFSHYKMFKRMGRYTRDFASFTQEQLTQNSESVYSPLQQGKYFEIIGTFKKLFSAEQIRIELTEEMEFEPQNFLKRLLLFLNVNTEYLPENLHKKFYKGSSKAKFPSLTKRLSKTPGLKFLWHLFSKNTRMKLITWYYTEFNIVKDAREVIPPDVQQLLRNYYQADVDALQTLLGRPLPWKNFK
jgi:hypothetical protein